MRSIRITIKNWAKYNPRSDRANHSWFRLENSIMTSEDLFGLKIEHKWVWICLLCLASKKGETFDVQLEWLSATSGVPPKTVAEAVRELMDRPQICTIEIHARNQATPSGNQSVSLLLTTDGRDGRNERDVTNNTKQTDEHLAMLETVYQKFYPLKKGKSKGLEKAAKSVRPEEIHLFETAAKNYHSDCERRKVEPKFIKHFSTWVGEWRDWTDPEAGTSVLDRPKSSTEHDWKAVASQIWNLCQQHSYSLSPKIRELLGPDLVAVVKASGELYELRTQPKNDFTLNGFASRLKAAHESLSEQKGA